MESVYDVGVIFSTSLYNYSFKLSSYVYSRFKIKILYLFDQNMSLFIKKKSLK